MGAIDTLAKAYVGDRDVFADICNFYLFNGEQVIHPLDLRPEDTFEIAIPYENETNPYKLDITQKSRDLLKSAAIMADQMASYIVLGIENQAEVSYIMPVRNAVYDYLQYDRQIHAIAREHKKAADYKGHNEGEFLSGFFKSDGLRPVFTIVIYWGTKEWDAPLCLRDMIAKNVPKRLLEQIDNYHIRLIEPMKLSEQDLKKFRSDFGILMNFLKLSKNKKKMLEEFNSEKGERKVRNTGIQLLNACTGSKLKYDKKEEVTDMCEAIQGIMDDSKAEGRAEGKAEGRAEGIMEGKHIALYELVSDGILTVCEGARRADQTEEVFQAEMAAYYEKNK